MTSEEKIAEKRDIELSAVGRKGNGVDMKDMRTLFDDTFLDNEPNQTCKSIGFGNPDRLRSNCNDVAFPSHILQAQARISMMLAPMQSLHVTSD